MVENTGYYEKYNVFRKDGKPVGRTFTLELDRDQHAIPALKAYVKSLKDNGNEAPRLQHDLKDLIKELEVTQS